MLNVVLFRSTNPWRFPLNVRSGLAVNVGVGWLGYLLAALLAGEVDYTAGAAGVIRLAVRGQPVFSSDRGHIHHRLMARGLSHRATVLALYGIAIVLASLAVVILGDARQPTAPGPTES